MKVTSILAASALAAGVSAQASASPLKPVAHNLLWPRPQQFTSGSTDRTINPNTVAITIVAVNGNQALLEKAAKRLRANALSIGCNDSTVSGDITNVSVTVTGTDPKDLAQADESYTLKTDNNAVTITANHSVGALRALETLAQLIKPNEKLPFHVKTDAAGCATAKAAGFKAGFVVPSGPWNISDKPSYSFRGVSLDTSRNYIPVASILRTLDGLAASKLNVLHWHIVDATSFPVVSKTYPDLATSAYSKLSIYSYDDVKAVIAYAADRGIRVIPEFDSPAHANAYSFSKDLKPFVLCINGGAGGTPGFWPTCPEPPCGNINVADPKAAPAIAKLVKEYTALFPDSVFHLGGDEIENFCLAASPEFTNVAFPGQNITEIWDIKAPVYWAPKDGKRWVEGLGKVYQKYTDVLTKTLADTGKAAMFWEDVVLNDGVVAPKGSILQVWNSWDEGAQVNSMQKVLDLNAKGAGYKIVDTNNDYYYLDGGSGGWLTDRGIGYGGDAWKENYWTNYKSWQRVYTHDPRKSQIENRTQYNKEGSGLAGPLRGDVSAIIGGSVAIWGERISDSNLDVKLWPRAAAAAEAWWSADSFPDAAHKDFFEALPRLEVFRDRLIARGFGAETFQPYWCRNEQCGESFSGYGPGLAYGNEKPKAW
ncbi:glycoside hydrolase superfamily [Obelidium mucronatum]|nr:glycoside hydrolase superfamily [Obelidium mucronatum]